MRKQAYVPAVAAASIGEKEREKVVELVPLTTHPAGSISVIFCHCQACCWFQMVPGASLIGDPQRTGHR